ncbi:hypothetical protein Cgig2_031836 [Carnegiea gigantea]|uniref:S1 motif domain-containing protein n=1 Tax=Carnegiea gigantea TaxID=171969 RepID=A0A9Q1KT21_9CARY|nr:hypothetical protein Cgig2_031836 [Carnegiea gigantea]
MAEVVAEAPVTGDFQDEVELFSRWSFDDVTVHDMALGDSHVKHATYVPHTTGRYQLKRCRKAQCPIVERFANRVTLKNISSGMKLWGVIAEVNEKDLAVSLPGGLRGLVRGSEAIEPALLDSTKDVEGHILSSLFRIGQLVSCVVLQVDDDKKEAGKRKVWLSLRLSLLHKGYSLEAAQEGMVLTAYVKSIEDHGYILHFGLPSFTGFSPKRSGEDNREVLTGQLVQGVVSSIDKARKVVHLSSDPDMLAKCVCPVLDSPPETFVQTKDLKGISFDLLVPGMMVNARVQSTLENGIMLSFLTYFSGTVDIFHLQNAFPASDWKEKYDENKKVNARILFIDPSTRAVGLTMNPHLLHNKAPPLVSLLFFPWLTFGAVIDYIFFLRFGTSLG